VIFHNQICLNLVEKLSLLSEFRLFIYFVIFIYSDPKTNLEHNRISSPLMMSFHFKST